METKKDLVQILNESIVRNCKTEEDVLAAIKGIYKMIEFFVKQKQKPRSLILQMLKVKEVCAENSCDEELRAAEDATDMVTSTLLHAEELEHEIDLLYGIVTDMALVKAIG